MRSRASRAGSMLEGHRRVHEVGAATRERLVARDSPALARRGIGAMGLSLAREGFRFATNGWVHAQVLGCVAGRGRAQVAGKWQEVNRGQAYLSPAGVPHAYEAIAGQDWCVGWVIFERDIGRVRQVPGPEAGVVEADCRMLFRAIGWLYRETIGTGPAATVDALAELVALEARRIAADPVRDGRRLRRAWEAIDADPARPWRVEALADLIDVSPDHFRRLCRQQVGYSPAEQLARLRMRRAFALLSMSEMKIEAIASSVGYADRFGFSTAFRRMTGMTPAEYRRRERERSGAPHRSTGRG